MSWPVPPTPFRVHHSASTHHWMVISLATKSAVKWINKWNSMRCWVNMLDARSWWSRHSDEQSNVKFRPERGINRVNFRSGLSFLILTFHLHFGLAISLRTCILKASVSNTWPIWWLSRLEFRGFPQSVQALCHRIGYDHFFPDPYLLIITSTAETA